MKRQLTVRERTLLIVLGIVALVGAYVTWVYTPLVNERERCDSEVLVLQDQVEIMKSTVQKQEQMERELEEIFERNPNPLSLPDYDNAEPMMRELHAVLGNAQSYSLAFGAVDTSATVARRSITMTFTASDYASAKRILTQLDRNSYRCMLDGMSLNFGYRDGSVSVSGNIVFFEYQAREKTTAS